MSAEIDPAKLKVVELRAELSSRGLDTKGNKPVLVKRLKDALEEELKKELPDTSIADTSTEDLNTSQTDESDRSKEDNQKDAVPAVGNKKEVQKTPEKLKDDNSETITEVKELPKETSQEDQPQQKMEDVKPTLSRSSPMRGVTEAEEKDNDTVQSEVKPEPLTKDTLKQENDNKEVIKVIKEEFEDEAPVKFDENGIKADNQEEKSDNNLCSKDIEEAIETGDDACASEKPIERKDEVNDSQPRGDKRKRSPSPSRAQRRRSKSPIKEDEPVIDSEKVHLNWYDSDLHLQIDKESFLSGKPYHDGAFGYIWSGVRATHGADTGKVCYEVKITEELKWEDFIRQPDRSRRDRERKDSRRDRSERRDKSSDKRKSGDKSTDKKDAKVRDKDDHKQVKESSKPDEKADEVHEKSTEEEIAQDKDKTQMAVDDQETIEEIPIEINQDATTKSTEAEMEVVHIEKSELDVSQKEEKSDEVMEVDEAKVQEKKDDGERKEEKSKEGKRESKDKETTPIPLHLIRIGWSSLCSGLQLGESKFSYGYESSGKFVHDKNFADYGKPFSVGDIIGAYLEFSEETISMKYTLNGEELPVAASIPRTEVPEENFCLFPHVLSRNYAFEVNLGGKDEPFFKNPDTLSDFVYIDQFDNKVAGPTRPETRGDCEVIMMCGLPGSGKTHWVNEHVVNNPDKRYTVIGNTQLLEKMTVNGTPLKNSLKGRWNVVLDKLSKCLNKLVEVAALRRRNYIIDQTNVFPSAQRRKMRPFEGFKRRAVIVVCGDEEQARRRTLQEAQDGKDVPNIAVYEMKANMSLPKVGGWLEEVTYVELDEQQAKTMVQKYNKEGKDNGFGPFPQRRDYRDDRSRWQQNKRSDYRGGYRDRKYPPSRFDRGSKHGGWQPRSGGWGRNDRRDSRGSSSSRSRDWRNNNRGGSQRQQDRGRERSSRHSRDSYSRSRSQGGNRNQSGTWQSGSSGGGGSRWGSQGNWQGQGGGSNWNQNYGGQGKWNYSGQGGYSQQQNYGNYQNWNYQDQYQNWIGQGPQQTGANNGSGGGNTVWSHQNYSQNSGNQSAAQK